MGNQASGTSKSRSQISSGAFFMRPGDTFLYSVNDPRGKMMRYSRSLKNLGWTRWVTINPGDEGKKHMIYEGVVDEIVQKNGKYYYRYHMNKMWTTPDQYKNTGTGVVGPWQWQTVKNKPDDYRLFWFGKDNLAPCFFAVDPRAGYPATHTYPPNFPIANKRGKPCHSLLAPLEISVDDPNIGINGEFNRMTNTQIVKFLNNYATNAAYTGRTSVPEVQGTAKKYMSMSKADLEKAYKQKEPGVIKSFGNTMLTVQYRTSSGAPEGESMNVQSFLSRGITLLKSKDNIRDYVGLVADNGANYESIFNVEKDAIEKHRELFSGEKNFGKETVMPKIEIKSGILAYPNPKMDIPFVNVKDPMDTDQIFTDSGFVQIQRIINSDPSLDGWTQIKELDTNGHEKVMTMFYKNVSLADRVIHEHPLITESGAKREYVSGMARGLKRLDVAGSEDRKLGGLMYSSVVDSRAEYPENILKQIQADRIEILGMLQAYIQNNYSVRGTGGALDMIHGGSQVPNRMFLLSEALNARHDALTKAITVRNKIFREDQMEGFVSSSNPVIENVKESLEINRLRTAIEQNEAIADQIANESTLASTKFAGAVLSAGAFFAIAFYSLKQ